MAPAKLRKALGWIERSLLLIAIALLCWYAGVWGSAAIHQERDRRALERMLADRGVRPGAARGLIGRLEIPRIGIAAMVREGTDPDTLRRAIGHIPSTPLPGADGNSALTTHRDAFFRRLKDVRKGDRVVVTTTTGGRFTYVVRDARVVPPTEVSVLDPSAQSTLTLVTCYPFGFVGAAPDRYVVRAVIAGGPEGPASTGPISPTRHQR